MRFTLSTNVEKREVAECLGISRFYLRIVEKV